MVVLRFKKCVCNEWSTSHFSNQFWWTAKAFNSVVNSSTFLFGIHLTPLSVSLLTWKKYVCNKVELSTSELLPKLWPPKFSQESLVKKYSDMLSFEMLLHKANEFYLFKNTLKVVTGSVMSCETSTVLIRFETLRLFCFTETFNSVMFECQEMNLICNP